MKQANFENGNASRENKSEVEAFQRPIPPVNVYTNILKNQTDLEISSLRLARELIFTHTLLMAHFDEYLRGFDLSWSKLFILLWLRAYQQEQATGLIPSKLSELLGVGRNTVSTLLEGLEQQGYVQRELDTQDKRRFIITITPSGGEVARQCLTTLDKQLEILLEPMEVTQRESLTNALIQLRHVLLRPKS